MNFPKMAGIPAKREQKATHLGSMAFCFHRKNECFSPIWAVQFPPPPPSSDPVGEGPPLERTLNGIVQRVLPAALMAVGHFASRAQRATVLPSHPLQTQATTGFKLWVQKKIVPIFGVVCIPVTGQSNDSPSHANFFLDTMLMLVP